MNINSIKSIQSSLALQILKLRSQTRFNGAMGNRQGNKSVARKFLDRIMSDQHGTLRK